MIKRLATLALPLAILCASAHADVLETYTFRTNTPYSTTGPNANHYQGLVGTFTEDITTGSFASWYVWTDGGSTWQFSNTPIGGETLTVLQNNLDSGLWQRVSGYGQSLLLELSPMGGSGWATGDNDGAFIETGKNQYEYQFASTLVSAVSVPEPGMPALMAMSGFSMFLVRRRKGKH